MRTWILDLARRRGVNLSATLDSEKQLRRLYVEFGAPIVFKPER